MLAENILKDNPKLQNQNQGVSAPRQNASSAAIACADKENQNEHTQTVATQESAQSTKKPSNP